jgi:Zn-dependent M16 (insulinase) family peptidase
MIQEDMFSHKLCALLDRKTMIARDIFDCWFFMQKRTPFNKDIIESRMEMPIKDYLDKCIQSLESISDRILLQGLGELMDNKMKRFVKTKLRPEVISLLKLYQNFPI